MVELARVREPVAATASRIWEVLTDFGHPQRLASSIEACAATGDGVGATRVVKARGLVIHERLDDVDPIGHRFRYRVLDSGDPPAAGVTGYVATVVLHPVSVAVTDVEWSSEGEVEGQLEPIAAHFDALYRRAIANLRIETAA
jgi:carbon monoxide dehydrogenase subunit G